MSFSWPPEVIKDQVIVKEHHNGLRDNVVRKKTALEGQLFFTQGSVLFADSSGFLDEDNANLSWDNINKRLGIGTATPAVDLHVDTPGSVAAEIAVRLNNPSSASFASTIHDFFVAGARRAQISGVRDGVTSGGFLLFKTVNSGGSPVEFMRVNSLQNVGIGTPSPTSALHIGTGSGSAAAITIDEESATPANPTADVQLRVYMKADKLIIQFNKAGTIHYFTIDLTATASQQVAHTTSAP
ncbi:MAG TPA: hypothetical protein ENI05_09995 [Porticoccus sp.]|nr:hypothetical protein [Porticoccus sp.]